MKINLFGPSIFGALGNKTPRKLKKSSLTSFWVRVAPNSWLKYITHAKPNQVQNKGPQNNKERNKKKGGRGEGGTTMFHNKLQPSKVVNECRNIPISIIH